MASMIPRDTESVHFNFPESFILDSVQKHLVKLQQVLSSSDEDSHIVLNLEKCQWFDIYPLAQLLTIISSHKERKPTIHIVGPCVDILPYIHDYISHLKDKLQSGQLGAEERQKLRGKITRHSETTPKSRARAGAFLVGWGAFDLLEDHYGKCRWYISRVKQVSLSELRDSYQFGYGSSSAGTSHTSDRVWPFTVLYPEDQRQIIDRINGEELIAGALHKYAKSDVIADGTASNVFFFEPFENVFMHAFPNSIESKLALMAMRVNDWMYSKDGTLIQQGQWLLSKLPEWERLYIESLKGKPFMEITICDCGVGIPATIGSMMILDERYCEQRHFSINNPPSSTLAAWEAIKYAFEPYSTGRLIPAPGNRGLAWLREKIAENHGLIQVVSNGGNYVLVDYGSGLIELSPQETMKSVKPEGDTEFVGGTFIRIVFPLNKGLLKTPERRPRWDRRRLELSLFVESSPVSMRPFILPDHLLREPDLNEWHSFFNDIESEISESPEMFAVLDFARQDISRWSLEHLFASYTKHKNLHGRTLITNSTRHVACRLDTILSIIQLRESNIVVPLFETNLRLYWVGAEPEAEAVLLRWFQHGPTESFDEIVDIAKQNPGYFIMENDMPREFAFGVEEVEDVVRRSLGQALYESLKRRDAVYRGRFIMPLTGKTITTFVEPHQIFADNELADLLCGHLAVLLRWRYGRMSHQGYGRMRVLTATRIGRDIAIHMPEAYPQKYFVYFDYHLIQPSKPRLIKYLADNSVVIVVDIISTGSQVEELIKVCEDAGCNIIGIISFIDFSPETAGDSFRFTLSTGKIIEHKTFLRLPQIVSDPLPSDRAVNKETFSVSPAVEFEAESVGNSIALLSKNRGLRLLEDSQTTHYGHYELFGRHLDFATNLGRLITAHSPQLDEILRATEDVILKGQQTGVPTAIVLYPDFSNIHILEGILMRRPRIRALTKEERRQLQFVEARRGSRARGRRYWLTKNEITQLKNWAKDTYGDQFSVLLLDDIASSGETLLALLDLARELEPAEVSAFVLVNRMPHLRTHHHRQIERFAWASSSFRCLLHLNVPTFSRENCPLCRERAELLREFRHAQGEWFKKQIENRLEELELITALHPQDVPEGPYATEIRDVAPFFWEDEQIFPGPKQTVISRALSVRTAIDDGISIHKILQAVLDQPNDDLWRLTAIEIGRRVDLHLSQHVETTIRDHFVKVLAGRTMSRRIAALEALRYMRPEITLPAMRHIVSAALRFLQGDEIIAELLLLMRRVFSYRHLATSLAFDEEQAVARELDQAAANVQPGSPVRDAIERINFEWGRGPQPKLNLVNVIRELEKIFKTQRHQEHRLLYELAEYIGDTREDVDLRVIGALDDAVRATSLSRIFISSLYKLGRLSSEELIEQAEKAYKVSRELRTWVTAHMNRSESKRPRDLFSKLDDLKELCEPIQNELKVHLVDPSAQFNTFYKNFLQSPPSELSNVELNISLDDQLPKGTIIIVDRARFRDVVKNLLSNLKHAIDPETTRVSATFTLYQRTDQFGPQIGIRVKCKTSSKPTKLISIQDSTTNKLRQEAEPYGVEFNSNESDNDAPWEEKWNFWRL